MIISKLELNSKEIIQDILFKQNFSLILVLSKQTENQNLILRGYFYSNLKEKISFEQKLEFSYDEQDYFKMISNEPDSNVFILTESKLKPEINVYILQLAFNLKLSRNRFLKIKFEPKRQEFILKNSCLTFSSNYLALFYDHELYYFELKTGTTIYRKNFYSVEEAYKTMEYYLSPTFILSNSLTNLTPIPNSDHLIALNNLDYLILVLFKKDKLNSTSLIQSFNEMKFDSAFKLDSNSLVLLAFDKLNSKLVAFDLNLILKKKSFTKSCILFRIDFETIANFYSLDSSLVFSIENGRILKLFKFNKEIRNSCKFLGQISLYCQINSCSISPNEHFISLAMQDGKVVSYFIDQNSNICKEKLKSLSSR